MKIEHLYIEFSGRKYEDCTAYVNRWPAGYNSGSGKYTLVVDSSYDSILRSSKIQTLCDQNFKPNLGDEVHVVPDCIIPVQDIRNHYKLKRKYDDGTCNVYSPIPVSGKGHSFKYHHTLIDEHNKTFIFIWSGPLKTASVQDIKNQVSELVSADMSPDEIANSSFSLHYRTPTVLNFLAVNEAYRNLLTGSHIKPCIYYERLDMDRNDLTEDQLFMLYETALKDNKEAYVLQLSALAQTNWKEYPVTMYNLFHRMLYWKGVHYYVRISVNGYPKQVREILNYKFEERNAEHISDKDRALLYSLLEHILKIDKCKFATTEVLRDKLSVSGITNDLFEMFYDTVVKITPKRNEGKENSVSDT